MNNDIVQNINALASIMFICWLVLWTFFAYYTYKVTSGIKKQLGGNYYLIVSRWPNVDNPDTRQAIKDSPELTRYYKLKNKAFIACLAYLVIIVIPFFTAAFYYGS